MFEEIVNVQKLDEMLGNARTDIPKQNKANKVGAVYFLYNKYDELIYIGKSENLAFRLWQHRKGKASTRHFHEEIEHVKYIRVDSPSFRTCLEGLFIQHLRPRENSEIANRKPLKKRTDIETVRKIKKMLMNGTTIIDTAERVGVGHGVVIGISNNTAWKGIYVEGFNEWANLSKREKQLNKEDSNAA